MEEAAIGGHTVARHNLANIEMNDGRHERGVKHFIIAANLGDERSMKELWKCFSMGHVSIDDLTATLCRHHAAVNATKSPQREAAEDIKGRFMP